MAAVSGTMVLLYLSLCSFILHPVQLTHYLTLFILASSRVIDMTSAHIRVRALCRHGNTDTRRDSGPAKPGGGSKRREWIQRQI